MFKAIIPIKNHSSRISRKNFKLFNGKPLYYWVLEELKKVAPIETIIMDTDSSLLEKRLKGQEKIVVKRRPANLIGDDVSVNKIIEHNLNQVEGDFFIQTHVTNPLLTAQLIEEMIQAFLANAAKFDSLFSVTAQKKRFYFDGQPVNHNPNELIKTQDLEPVLEENSNMYVFTRKSFFANSSNRIGKKPFLYAMSQINALDIDTIDDFKIAQLVHKSKLKQNEKST